MVGIKKGAAHSTKPSAVASRKSHKNKRLAQGDQKRKAANRRKAAQKKRDDEKKKLEVELEQQRADEKMKLELELEKQKGRNLRNLALLVESQKDRGTAYVNDSSTQLVLARAVVGPAADATVPPGKAAAVREPDELSEGEVQEDESVSEPELSDGEVQEDESVSEPELSDGEVDEDDVPIGKSVARDTKQSAKPSEVAAVREPELSDGEVDEDESGSVAPAGSNVPIGKSVDRDTKQFAKPSEVAAVREPEPSEGEVDEDESGSVAPIGKSVDRDTQQVAKPAPSAHSGALASPIPRKRMSAPTSALVEPSLVGLLQANIGTPSMLVGVALGRFSKHDIAACAGFELYDFRRHHLALRLTERSGLKFPQAVTDLLRKGTIRWNPNRAGNNSALAVASVDEQGVCHWFPFDAVDKYWMCIRTYFAHSPLRRDTKFNERRRFVLKGLRWLAETIGVPFEEVVEFLVAALSSTELHKLSCQSSSPSIEDLVILEVIASIQPTDEEFEKLSNIQCASSMGDFEAWIVGFHGIPRVEEKFPFMRSAAKQRYELSLVRPTRHPSSIDEAVLAGYRQGFLRW